MIITTDPSSGKIISEYDFYSNELTSLVIDSVYESYNDWKFTDLSERISCVKKLAEIIDRNKEEIASLITSEMGKLFSESIQEVNKSISYCNYICSEAHAILMPNKDIENLEINYFPIGVIFGVMPWNFPLWQVIRFALPALIVGNGVILKHAPNVTGLSIYIERIIKESGFSTDIFRSLIISNDMVHKVIENDKIHAVSFTGSDKVGSLIASTAGKNIKKTVLELGGSDPFIILDDADIDIAFDAAFKARMQNMGQSCIAGKRFIIEESIYNRFIDYIYTRIESLVVGDPFDPLTLVAPLSTLAAKENANRQVLDFVNEGAEVIVPRNDIISDGFYYMPRIITNVNTAMVTLKEEIFAPIFTIIPSSKDRILYHANDTIYGLGASVWTSDKEFASYMASNINSGMVFINEITMSSPEIPFGGVKKSGYGRELSSVGLLEFANIKSIYRKY